MSDEKHNSHASHGSHSSSHTSHPPERLLPPRGDYQTLLSFQKAQIVYDITFRFASSSLLWHSRPRLYHNYNCEETAGHASANSNNAEAWHPARSDDALVHPGKSGQK